MLQQTYAAVRCPPPAPRPRCAPPYWQSADGGQASIDFNGPGPFSLAANPDNTLSPQSCVRVTTASSQQDYCFNVLNVDGQGT